MPPSVIGEIVERAKVKYLVLLHRMDCTFGHEPKAMFAQGALSWPNGFCRGFACFKL
jgi:hypothetical protein